MAPILGLLLILRRQSLMADTLSHVSLAGVALGMLLNINPTLTTLAIVILAAIGIEYLRVIFKGYSEISIAILMATGMAVALVLMSFVSGKQNASVEQFLFGSIITINDGRILILLALAIIVVLLYLIFRKPLYVLTFDEDTAHTAGLPVRLMSLLVSAHHRGRHQRGDADYRSLLVSSIMILPAAISMRLVHTFNGVILLGIGIGLTGMYGDCSHPISTGRLPEPPSPWFSWPCSF